MQEGFVSIKHTDLPRRRAKKCVIWVLQEAGAKMGLNMPGFNKENACDGPCVGSWHGWDCQHERKEEKSSGGCILVGLAEVYPGGQEVLEWKLADGGVLCHPGTSSLRITALCSPEGSVASVQTAAGSQIAAAGVSSAPCSWRSLRHILIPCRRVSYRGLRQLEKAKRVPVENRSWLLPRTHTHTHRVCGRPTCSERYKYIPFCKVMCIGESPQTSVGLGCWHGDHSVTLIWSQPAPKQRGQSVFLLDRKHVFKGVLVEELRRKKRNEEKERRVER